MTLETLYSVTALKANTPRLEEQYLRVQLAFNKNAKPGEAGYAPKEVVDVLSNIDQPSDFDGLVKIGRALGMTYRPILQRFVADYLLGK